MPTPAEDLRRIHNRQKGQCTWCGSPVGKGRSTWCSDACVTAYREEHDWDYIRGRVRDRDKGVCALCGFDTEQLQRIIRSALSRQTLRQACLSGYEMHRHVADWLESVNQNRVWKWAQWQADHITPRCRGGSNELSNLRTLCVACHKVETARLARDRAAERRDAERPLLTD